MTIYNVNKAIGRASSGVEYAQAYRNKLLQQLNYSQKYIYTDFIYKNIIEFTTPMGFAKEAIIWVYGFMADRKNSPSTYQLTEFEKTLANFEKTETETTVEYQFPGSNRRFVARMEKNGSVEKIDSYHGKELQSSAHYTDKLLYEEFFADKKRSHRIFYHSDGTKAYLQTYQDDDIQLTFIDGKVLYGKAEFFDEFYRRLEFKADDFIILDRNFEIGQSVLKNKGAAQVAVVIHAEHYNLSRSTKSQVLWNNFYEYAFTNHQAVDYYITSTTKQTQRLEKQMKQAYKNVKAQFLTIPVGAVATPDKKVDSTKKYKAMTASRLAEEKHIDQIIRAVVIAKADIPELTFDIYGEGRRKQKLKEVIKELKAQDYIKLKGHVDLTDVYPQYGVYLTASLSEGFGLSLLEALANGHVFAGFNVDYGNTEFIEPFYNGLLTERVEMDKLYLPLAKEIVKLYQSDFDFEAGSLFSYEKAMAYTDERIKMKWQDLFSNQTNKEVVK